MFGDMGWWCFGSCFFFVVGLSVVVLIVQSRDRVSHMVVGGFVDVGSCWIVLLVVVVVVGMGLVIVVVFVVVDIVWLFGSTVRVCIDSQTLWLCNRSCCWLILCCHGVRI